MAKFLHASLKTFSSDIEIMINRCLSNLTLFLMIYFSSMTPWVLPMNRLDYSVQSFQILKFSNKNVHMETPSVIVGMMWFSLMTSMFVTYLTYYGLATSKMEAVMLR